MSGWDWLQAGLELATYSQARKAQENIAAVQADMQSAAMAAQVEAMRKAYIEAMRNLVFDISRDLQLAEEHIDEYPVQVYIVARTSDIRFKDSGLSPEVFPEFSDKEYVHNTQRKISSVVAASRSKLTEDQFEQAEIAIKSLTEMPLLQEAITAKSSLEQIQASDVEWNKLESAVSSSKTKRNFGIVTLIASPCLCVGLGATGGDQATLGAILGFLALVGALFLLFGSRVNMTRYNELKAQREELRKNLVSADKWHLIMEKFGGDLPSEQYQNLMEQRIAFLNSTLGTEFQNFLTES
jgi:hypothetical protein